jgi:lysophospholipase L1-like esterase
MRKIFSRTVLLFYHLLVVIVAHAQMTTTLPSGVRMDDNPNNRFIFCGNSELTYASLFNSLNRLVLKGEGTINIIQVGDSHIQAGFLPEEMRKDFSIFITPGCGARGLIFPYRIAKTNNPVDYSVRFTGKWDHCRNVEVNKNCSLGLMGIMVQTHDTASGMTFIFKENITFRDFNFVRILCDPSDTGYRIEFPGLKGRYHINTSKSDGFITARFDSIIHDSLRIRVIKKDTTGKYFTFYGIDFENGDPGFVYSASGVNGAEVSSFLRCDKFKDQLAPMKPDWVILSLGTNDAYPVHFNENGFIENYISLIKKIREVNPSVPILLTVPGDSYRRHRYDNVNMKEAREAILEIAKHTDCAVWDFYSLMGGPKSILNWYKAGLVAKDKLHFDKQGYLIQADLLFNAFVDAYSSFIDHSNEPD